MLLAHLKKHSKETFAYTVHKMYSQLNQLHDEPPHNTTFILYYMQSSRLLAALICVMINVEKQCIALISVCGWREAGLSLWLSQ